MIAARSFDVFDTCLVRSFATSRDIHGALAGKALGEPCVSVAVKELAEIRWRAEGEARRNSEAGEVTIAEIYRWAEPEIGALGLSAQGLLESELGLERASLRPVPALRRAVTEARDAGLRVVFLSDMYLPGSFIFSVLQRYGFTADPTEVLVSGEVGASETHREAVPNGVSTP